MTTRQRKLELDYDTADSITLLVLKDYRKLIKQNLNAHFNDGEYVHPDDLAFYQTTLLPALKVVINQFARK